MILLKLKNRLSVEVVFTDAVCVLMHHRSELVPVRDHTLLLNILADLA